ncbi:MAG TPA: methyl-accepting chemotaxis protein, partial [Rariglobus sp.]
MKTWTIGKRIITGGTILIVLLLIVGSVAISALSRLEQFAGSRLRDDAIPGIVVMGEMFTQSLRGQLRVMLAGASPDAAALEGNIGHGDKNFAAAAAAMDAYQKSVNSDEDRKNLGELKIKRAAYDNARESYYKLLREGNKADAARLYTEKLDTSFTDYRYHMAMMLKWNQDEALSVSSEMAGTASRATRVTTLVVAASLLTAAALGWLIIRGVNRVLRHIAATLNDASTQVSAAAKQVSTASQSLAQGASEQAASLEEISSMTGRNADSAENARTISAETNQATVTGTGQMGQMVEAMNAIKTSSDNIAK